MDIYRELAALSDEDAELCLNGVLKGFIIARPQYADIVSAPPGDLAAAVRELASDLGESIERLGEPAPIDRPRAVRLILIAIAEDSDLQPRLLAWFSSARPTLLEPVTSALILAGIVMVLSTDIKVHYEMTNGKRHLQISVEKKATPNEIIQKIFGFFH